MQRLLYQAKWDVDAVCADVGDYVAEHLGEPDAVLVVDERAASPRRGPSPQASRRSTAAPAIRSSTARSACSSPTSLPGGRRWSTGSCTYQKAGVRIANAVRRPASPSRSGSHASSSSPPRCWPGWSAASRPAGWPRMRCMGPTPGCGPGWKADGWGTCWASERSTEWRSSPTRAMWSRSRPAS